MHTLKQCIVEAHALVVQTHACTLTPTHVHEHDQARVHVLKKCVCMDSSINCSVDSECGVHQQAQCLRILNLQLQWTHAQGRPLPSRKHPLEDSIVINTTEVEADTGHAVVER